MRFFLTTAIDYVNSRPHLGTAYEKIRADVIARYKRLCGHRDALPDGQRRALAERVPEGAASWASIRSPTAIRWSRRSARSGRSCRLSFDDFIRTTEPRHRAGVQQMAQAQLRRAATSTRASTRAGTASACEAFKQEKDLVDGKCPIHLTTARVDPREELLLPAVEVSAAAARSLRRASGVHPAGHPPERDPAAGRRRARGHLDQPRRAVVGHSAAVRSVERRLRLVRRADQLRVGRRLRHRRRAVRRRGGRRTCTSIGKDITRFHCVDLAGDADERRAAAAAPGLRPRLGDVQGPADEQVARHRRRSARGRGSPRRRIRCGCISSRRSPSAATATSRGSGSRSATTSTSRTTSATSSAA